mmetsp:Transcript_13229/g.37322  ORF Transcript_13229/g.37322 Transcript_13229/m.37322 type:complete len:295 (+) Transcript_13229:86-970(+)
MPRVGWGELSVPRACNALPYSVRGSEGAQLTLRGRPRGLLATIAGSAGGAEEGPASPLLLAGATGAGAAANGKRLCAPRPERAAAALSSTSLLEGRPLFRLAGGAAESTAVAACGLMPPFLPFAMSAAVASAEPGRRPSLRGRPRGRFTPGGSTGMGYSGLALPPSAMPLGRLGWLGSGRGCLRGRPLPRFTVPSAGTAPWSTGRGFLRGRPLPRFTVPAATAWAGFAAEGVPLALFFEPGGRPRPRFSGVLAVCGWLALFGGESSASDSLSGGGATPKRAISILTVSLRHPQK